MERLRERVRARVSLVEIGSSSVGEMTFSLPEVTTVYVNPPGGARRRRSSLWRVKPYRGEESSPRNLDEAEAAVLSALSPTTVPPVDRRSVAQPPLRGGRGRRAERPRNAEGMSETRTFDTHAAVKVADRPAEPEFGEAFVAVARDASDHPETVTSDLDLLKARRVNTALPTPSCNRREIAERWHDNVGISRKEIFGSADEKCMPKHLRDDAATMFAGYVGTDYRPGSGLLLLAINPGGGGYAYESRTAEDHKFLPLLMEFKQAEPSELMESFERVNVAFMRIVRGWNIWTILDPTLKAAGVAIEDVAYMNIVPYRTRGNVMPPAATRKRAWARIVQPSVDLLAPRAIIAMGKKAGGVVKRWYAGALPVYCVPRTNGDPYVSDAAKGRTRANEVGVDKPKVIELPLSSGDVDLTVARAAA